MMLAICVGMFAASGAKAEEIDGIKVVIDIQGEVVHVDVELLIPATVKEVWDVMTDFEHLPQFISNITSSKVIARKGNVVRVAQQGKTSFGPLSFEFQSERELTLNPIDSFSSRMISGNMKRFNGMTRLEFATGSTRIRYHSEAVPDSVLPVTLGRSLIEAETREHFREIRNEIARRKTAAGI